MEQERSHRQDVTPPSDALELAALVAQGPGRLCGHAAVAVRRGDDLEWAIRGPAIIEVRAHGNERLQHSHRRLDVENTFLLGPAGTVGVRDTFPDRDTKILVQRDKPVVARRLVEEGALNRHSALGKERADLRVRFESRREPLAGWKIEQIPGTGSSGACALEHCNQPICTVPHQAHREP